MNDDTRPVGARSTRVLTAIFFLSGASALVFETLWFQRAGLAVGNSVWATSLVLAAFMAGLALGAWLAARVGARIGRPVLAYALAELAIGATGVLLVVWLPSLAGALAPLFRAVVEQPFLLNLVRTGAVFSLLLMPSAGMGLTLPLLVRSIAPKDAPIGQALGRLYGWNTLGAVVGSLAGELWLIERFGMTGTALAAAAVNAVVAAIAFRLDLRPARDENAAAGRVSTRSARLLAAAALAGACLLALEVVWFRLLSLFVNATSTAQAVLLAVVLFGIGAGGLVAGALLGRKRELSDLTRPVALVAGVLTVVSYVRLTDSTRAAIAGWNDWSQIVLGALGLMLPVAFLSGILFTFLGHRLGDEMQAVRATGLLTTANTLGAMAGALVAGFVLLPGLGMERALFSLAAAYGVVAWLVPAAPPSRGTRGLLLASGLLFVLHVALFPFGLMERRYFTAIGLRWGMDGSHLVAVREGLEQTLFYLRKDFLESPLYYRLATDSFSMSGTAYHTRRYMKAFVYLPVAIHPRPRSALLISYGVGMTARALADTRELERIDVVDTSREVLEMAPLVFDDPEQSPLEDPRVGVHVEDGRHFLLTTTNRYDLITGEPPPPKIGRVRYLYTREYFELMRDRLAEGGIVSYWLPVHQLGLPDTRAMLAGFCAVFDDCSLWVGSHLDWIMVGTNGADAAVSAARFGRQWRDATVAGELHALGFERPELLGAQFLADGDRLRDLVASAPPLTDDHPKRLSDRFDPELMSAAQAVYDEVLDVGPSRDAFESSAFVRRLWPPSLRLATIERFGDRALLERVSPWRAPSVEGAEALRRVLTETALQTPVLRLFGTTWRHVRIAESAGLDAGARWIGAGALARREYATAAGAFRHSWEQSEERRDDAYAAVLALALAGDDAAAAELAALALTQTDDGPFRSWLQERFGISS